MTIVEAAERLGISRQALEVLVRAGRLRVAHAPAGPHDLGPRIVRVVNAADVKALAHERRRQRADFEERIRRARRLRRSGASLRATARAVGLNYRTVMKWCR